MSYDGGFDQFVDEAFAGKRRGAWGWASQDVPAILGDLVRRRAGRPHPRRHGAAAGVARDLLWKRWVETLDLDDREFDLEVSHPNESLGAAQAPAAPPGQALPLRSPGDGPHPAPVGAQVLRSRGARPQKGSRFYRASSTSASCDAVRRPWPPSREGRLPGRRRPRRPHHRRPSTDGPHPDRVTDEEMVQVAARAIEQMIRDMRAMTLDRNKWRDRARGGAGGRLPGWRRAARAGCDRPERLVSGGEPALGATELVVDDEVVHLPVDVDRPLTYDVLLSGGHVVPATRTRRRGERRGEAVVPWPRRAAPPPERRATSSCASTPTGSWSPPVTTSSAAPTTALSGHRLPGQPAHPGQVWPPDPPAVGGGTGLRRRLPRQGGRCSPRSATRPACPRSSAGTLLGAVRNNRLIGHDNDVDVAYLSEHRYPSTWSARASTSSGCCGTTAGTCAAAPAVGWNVRIDDHEDGSHWSVDVFAAHWVGDRSACRRTPASTSRRAGPPRSPPGLRTRVPGTCGLRAAAGPDLRPGLARPGPSFRYETPCGCRAGSTVVRRPAHQTAHWDAFHASTGRKLPTEPTSFARWVAEQCPRPGRSSTSVPAPCATPASS